MQTEIHLYMWKQALGAHHSLTPQTQSQANISQICLQVYFSKLKHHTNTVLYYTEK
jgi:hypothetical protein